MRGEILYRKIYAIFNENENHITYTNITYTTYLLISIYVLICDKFPISFFRSIYYSLIKNFKS